ncbi:MAG: family NAD(P)-dependent oxidoreductase, partial [Nevskia sp.]|nr:family NAD(P)-dependent oxidoreductase [Nevskia sp.]
MAALHRFLRGRFVDAVFAPRIDLHGKRIIVTGCAAGSIGFQTARILASWGADVIVTTRKNPAAIAAALRAQIERAPQHGRIDAHALDLADASSTNTFAAWVLENRGERLDVLVNN